MLIGSAISPSRWRRPAAAGGGGPSWTTLYELIRGGAGTTATATGTLSADPFAGTPVGMTIYMDVYKASHLGGQAADNRLLLGICNSTLTGNAYGIFSHGARDTWSDYFVMIGDATPAGIAPGLFSPDLPDILGSTTADGDDPITNGARLRFTLQYPPTGHGSSGICKMQLKIDSGTVTEHTYNKGSAFPSPAALGVYINTQPPSNALNVTPIRNVAIVTGVVDIADLIAAYTA